MTNAAFQSRAHGRLPQAGPEGRRHRTSPLPVIILTLVAVASGGAQAPARRTVPRAAVPRPESVIGFPPCTDYKLATYEQALTYFQQLDAATDRVRLVDIGRTVGGRTQVAAVISSEANMARLGRYKEIARRLALAQGLTDDAARSLAREGKAVVWIDFGLHSTEVGPAQLAPEVAYRVATDESPEMRAIREQVIFLLVPNMNPDGTTLVANWYTKHVGTPFERSAPPELYHHYAGHDNNRDWFMFNLPETRNVGRLLYSEWFPQIVYNQHQTAPFPARIFVPPFEDPMNPNIPPLVMRGINLVGGAMTRRLEQEGRRGAISRLSFDTWWNGGMRTAPYFHNMVGILTETAHNSASPTTYDEGRIAETFANGVSTRVPSTYYPSPWRGGEWHLRDTCDYMLATSLAALDIGAKRREEWLYDIYQMGRDAIRAGAQETYVVPADQWDPGTVVRLINVLRWNGIDVERATAAFDAGGRTYGAGSFIIRGAQPFRAAISDLLNPQVYPDQRLYPGGPPDRPYDITGWTLPIQMGVRVDRLGTRVEARSEPVGTAAPSPMSAGLPEAAGAYAIDTRANDAFTAVNRLLAGGVAVRRARAPLRVETVEWPPGAFIVAGDAGARVHAAVAGLGVRVAALAAPPPELAAVKMPRIGLYRASGSNADEGWTRWVFEQFSFPYASVRDAEIRAGNLAATYDVIVLPDATYDSMLSGLAPGSVPAEYTGGMTPRGVANLHGFVAGGGTLIALDSATELPLTAFGLPARNVTAGQRDSDHYVPGTLLRVRMDAHHPLAYGMPVEAAAFFIHSPAFALGVRRGRAASEDPGEDVPTDRSATGTFTDVAQYPRKDLLLSGWILGERVLAGRSAAAEFPLEKGRVVLLGFRTQHRGQTHGTFKLLFNALHR